MMQLRPTAWHSTGDTMRSKALHMRSKLLCGYAQHSRVQLCKRKHCSSKLTGVKAACMLGRECLKVCKHQGHDAAAKVGRNTAWSPRTP